MSEFCEVNPAPWPLANASNCVYGNTSFFCKIGCHESDIPPHFLAQYRCTSKNSSPSCGDVIELIKREFGGLCVGDGHGFVRVRCVGVGCVGGE